MPISRNQIALYLAALATRLTMDEAKARLASVASSDAAKPLPLLCAANAASIDTLWHAAGPSLAEEDRAAIADERTLSEIALYAANIENMVGTIKVPVGVIGPLRVNGLHASGEYVVPLATTEAALVASYHRGARVATLAGGVSAALLSDGMLRAPVFAFSSIFDAGAFCVWITESFDMLKRAAEATTRFGKLVDVAPQMEGDSVYLVCRYTTGDAAGQNMATAATEALCQAVLANCPVVPRYWFVEGNFSGDKKASALAFVHGRGRSVTASVTIPRTVIEAQLGTSAERMCEYWRTSALGGVMSGTIGVHGHYANGLAALYLATGQDVACVAESTVGVTRMEIRDNALFVSVLLPNLVVGTVGGGTSLPSQAAALRLLGLHGAGHAAALAEVAAATCLAGEVSIIAALASGGFARAHRVLARQRR